MLRNTLLSLVIFALAACNETLLKQSPTGGPILSMSSIGYADVSREVFDARCLHCHGTNARMNFAGYENAKANAAAAMNSINAGRMPSGYALSSRSRQILALWISKGMPLEAVSVDPGQGPGDGGDDTPTLPPLAPTYASLKEHIFSARCTACHNASNVPRLSPLTSREEIINPRADLLDFDRPERSLLVVVIKNRTQANGETHNDDNLKMPPISSGIEAVTQEQLDVLKEWIRLGAPE